MINAIFNGVAMICAKTTWIWGFALMVCMYNIMASVTATSLNSVTGNAGGILAKGSVNSIMPLIFAMVLTVPALQCSVQVESTVNGKVTVVDHVPFVIAAIPAAGSAISLEAGSMVSTAFQSVGTNYPAISASNNGFVNPLKALLSARTAVSRLSGIDSEISTLVSSCMSSSEGLDYTYTNSMIINAGNTGASSGQTIQILGSGSTSIGALLYIAAQSNGSVVNLQPQNSQILSCSDAANIVANDIGNALSSSEFKRVVQGAVNGMDQPIPGADYSFPNLQNQYAALRNAAKSVTDTNVVATSQANTELINFAFAEVVNSDLNCLQSNGADKTVCQAQMVQATEIERNNIQAASNEVPMLKYAGSFGNYILALIIGLGPIIVMFMMFSGVDAGKNIKTVVHIMVWPMLVMNVGAEVVNGMISISIANFMTSLAQGGYLSHAVTHAMYKELSLQIGTASHIMASLPVLMSMIFALGESSALTSVANSIAPKGTEVAQDSTPMLTNSAPIIRESSMATGEQGDHFAQSRLNGAISSVAGSEQLNSVSKEMNNTISAANTKQHTLSEGNTNLADWKEAFAKNDYKKVGVDSRTGAAIKENYEKATRENDRTSIKDGVTSTKSNANSTSLGANAGASVTGTLDGSLGGVFKSGVAVRATAGVTANTSTSAQDSMQGVKGSSRDQSIDESKALSKAVSTEMAKGKFTGSGSDTSKNLAKTLDTQKSYQDVLSDTKTMTDADNQIVKGSSNFVGQYQKIGSTEIGNAAKNNDEFRMFNQIQGREFDQNVASQKYMQIAEKDMKDGASDTILNNPDAHAAAVRYRAAGLMATDENASAQVRATGIKFAAASTAAMLHGGVKGEVPEMRKYDIAAPQDNTGVNSTNISTRANNLDPTTAVKPPAPKHASGHSHATHPHPTGSKPLTFEQSMDALKKDAAPDGKDVYKERASQENEKTKAGLNVAGPHTGARVIDNVGNNIKTIFQPNGTPSNVSVGDPRLRANPEPAHVKGAQITNDNTPPVRNQQPPQPTNGVVAGGD